MIRGTTPTIEVKVSGIEIAELESIYITLKQYQKEVTKSTDDITIVVIMKRVYVRLCVDV